MFEGCVAHCEHIVDPGHRFGQFNAPADWRSCAKACLAPVSKSSGAAISCGFDHSQLDGRLRFIAFVREIGLCSPPVVAAETSISFRPSRSCFGHCRLFRALKSKIEWQQHNQMKMKISEWLEFWSCGKEFSRRIGVVGQFVELGTLLGSLCSLVYLSEEINPWMYDLCVEELQLSHASLDVLCTSVK